jgi:hypothetical protein
VNEWSGYRACLCLAVDAQSYGRNNDQIQSEIQHDLPRILDKAAFKSGFDRSQWRIQPKGDEQLAVLPLDGDEARLVDDYFRHLASELRHYNGRRTAEARMRLRAAVHQGRVELADNGFAGTAIVVTARLLGSEPLYAALAAVPTADLALVLSDDVYRSLVAGGHTTLRPADFDPVTVRVKEYEAVAWVTVPAHGTPSAAAAGPAHRTDRERDERDDRDEGDEGDVPAAPGTDPAGARHDYRAQQLSVTHNNGPVDARGAVFGFGNTHA